MTLKNNFPFTSVFFAGLVLFSHHLSALCERADIDYYLDKGFTPEQITKLCTVGSEKKAASPPTGSGGRYLPYQHLPYQQQPGKGIPFLLSAIAATDIHFSDDSFSYVSRDCIEYDPRPAGTVIRPKQFCGYMRKTIFYENLTVINTPLSKVKVFGPPSITIKGRIEQEVLDLEQLERLTQYDRKLFMSALKSMQSINLPIREEFLTGKTKVEIKKLSR